MNYTVTLVTTQFVEDYSWEGSEPYFKFKGGSHFIVPVAKRATAIALVLQHLHSKGLSTCEYPLNSEAFKTKDEAIASLPDWEQESVVELPLVKA